MTLEIRPLQPADRAAWQPLCEGYLAFYKRPAPADLVETAWSRMMDPAHPVQARGAFEDGKLLGIVHFFTHPSTLMVAPTCYLQDLFTVPEARGKGVGRALIARVCEEAKAQGCFRVYWHTHETNAEAQVLYNKVATRSGFIVYQCNF
ncbi:MAG TPA: GNAT family N-acetyltransferase [Rhabdaerophilum sp.]|nr:GNAT family N-acetyltransferase [Rhabdaerophilum sp.]